ncbi:hypothetical protein F0562_033806 [Nyssa sinensis]|uniref:Small ribosomal subunit protein mS23 n=1 Tax=Nyssa sinensis TaxID=561372 RepID=A0A5J5AED7_9ASTE|nr:hypothetical protein F0562_033806 [Nyssa sinensis]
MSFMRGDLLSRTRKLVKGLAKAEPVWLKAMEQAPPVTFPRADSKVKQITLPEDVYIKKFFKKHPDSKHEDAIKICGFDPPPARVFGWRVLELKEQGVTEEEAMAVADVSIPFARFLKPVLWQNLLSVLTISFLRTKFPQLPEAHDSNLSIGWNIERRKKQERKHMLA